MKQTLLYGKRQHKPIARPKRFSYQQLFDDLVAEQLALPAPYRLTRVEVVKRAYLQDHSLEVAFAAPEGVINGTLLLDHKIPTIVLDYCPWAENNESGLFAFLAARLAEREAMAYLNVPIASQRLSLENVALEDFTTRYPLGWQLRSSYYFDRRSEEECMREMVFARAIDGNSKRLIQSSASLQALLDRPGGKQALAVFSANHFLHLKRPLSDLRLGQKRR